MQIAPPQCMSAPELTLGESSPYTDRPSKVVGKGWAVEDMLVVALSSHDRVDRQASRLDKLYRRWSSGF